MPWSPSQIDMLEGLRFRPQRGGYHRQDVERLRTRAVLAMRRGYPLPDLDAMPLRRTLGRGPARIEVDGVRTMLVVWAETTTVEDPQQQADREREEKIAALTAEDARVPQWTPGQIALVREKHFTRVGRRQRTAYNEREVNEYLDSVVTAMRQGLEIPDTMHAKFESAGMRRGYDCKEVDDFLDELECMRPEG